MAFPVAEHGRVARIEAQLVAARAALETGNAEALLAACEMALHLTRSLVAAARKEREQAPPVVRELPRLVIGEGM